jgi:hypothetical protein
MSTTEESSIRRYSSDAEHTIGLSKTKEQTVKALVVFENGLARQLP